MGGAFVDLERRLDGLANNECEAGREDASQLIAQAARRLREMRAALENIADRVTSDYPGDRARAALRFDMSTTTRCRLRAKTHAG